MFGHYNFLKHMGLLYFLSFRIYQLVYGYNLCKTRENFIFSEKGQNGNFFETVQAKTWKFSRSRMMKRSPLESSQKFSYLVEFLQISRQSKFHPFRGTRCRVTLDKMPHGPMSTMIWCHMAPWRITTWVVWEKPPKGHKHVTLVTCMYGHHCDKCHKLRYLKKIS